MALSRKERRALQAIYGPQKPWAYQKEMDRRRREAALTREIPPCAPVLVSIWSRS